MTNLLIYALPALGWGLMPIISRKMGGKPVEQLLGTTIAALAVGMIVNGINDIDYTFFGFVISMISGLFWGVGQLLQFIALDKSDVSNVMPISNGTQLLFTSLSSGILLSEWRSKTEIWASMVVILLVILAIRLFTKSENHDGKTKKITSDLIIVIIGSSLSLTGYVTITNYFSIDGLQIFLPQSLGMFLSALVILSLNKQSKERNKIYGNILTGCSWSIANISLFYAAAHLGLGLSYTISQLCVFVSIIGGILFLNEKKNRQETRDLLIGLTLFIISIYILSLFK